MLQNATSVPSRETEKDWSKSLFYSHTMRRIFGAETPFEQYGLYASFIGGMFIASRGIFRSYHALKASEFAPDSEDRENRLCQNIRSSSSNQRYSGWFFTSNLLYLLYSSEA